MLFIKDDKKDVVAGIAMVRESVAEVREQTGVKVETGWANFPDVEPAQLELTAQGGKGGGKPVVTGSDGRDQEASAVIRLRSI